MTEQYKRGFAVMSPEKQREITSRGGQAAHRKGKAHEFTPEEARVAGQRGGRAVSADRQHMSMIGRKGGQHAARRHRATDTHNRHKRRENVTQQLEQATQEMFPRPGEPLDSAPNPLVAGQHQPQFSEIEPSSP